MAKGRNKVFLQGNVGQDPELRYTQSGTAVVSLRVATPDVERNADGKYNETTEWHDVVAWGRLAEVIAEYVKTGDKIDIEGKLKTRKYEDKDGITRYTTEVVAREIIMLGSKNGGTTASADEDPQYDDDLPF